MQVTLTVTEGSRKGKTFTFRGHDTFLVGRGTRAHCRLPQNDPFFSRLHLLIEVNPPSCRLLDLGSTNGTKVNGQKVAAADLHDGDLVSGGDTVLRVTVEDLPSSPALVNGVGSRFPERPDECFAQMTPDPEPAGQSEIPTCAICLIALLEKEPPGGSWRDLTLPIVCAACEQQIRVQPQPIPGYRIVRQLGSGGMGIVYLALSPENRAVAVKTIRPALAGNELEIEKFLREANILRQLRHPHIVSFHDLGSVDGELVYFVMDYVRGADAATLLTQTGPLPVVRAVRLVCQMLEALAYAHAQGFVHRDLKPANLLVSGEGPREVAQVADFGLARAYQASRLSGLTMTGERRGTLQFVAPEQLTNYRETQPCSDIYSTGATLYNLLTNKYLFNFPPRLEQQFLMFLQDQPIPIRERRPDLPAALAAIVDRALAREPSQRFATVLQMREKLLPFA